MAKSYMYYSFPSCVYTESDPTRGHEPQYGLIGLDDVMYVEQYVLDFLRNLPEQYCFFFIFFIALCS